MFLLKIEPKSRTPFQFGLSIIKFIHILHHGEDSYLIDDGVAQIAGSTLAIQLRIFSDVQGEREIHQVPFGGFFGQFQVVDINCQRGSIVNSCHMVPVLQPVFGKRCPKKDPLPGINIKINGVCSCLLQPKLIIPLRDEGTSHPHQISRKDPE